MHESSSSGKGENLKLKDLTSYYYVTDLKEPQNSLTRGHTYPEESRNSEVQIENQEQAEDPCNEALHLGDGLVMQKQDPATVANLLQSSQEHSLSLKKIDLKCQIIKDHSRQCQCSTPKLHMYLLSSHQCDSFCKTTDEEDTVTLVTSDTQENVPQSHEDQSSFEILESDVTDTDLANIIKEERITMNGERSELSSFCEDPNDDTCASHSKMKREKKKKKIKIKGPLFKHKKGSVSQLLKSKLQGLKRFSKLDVRFKEPKSSPIGSSLLLRDGPLTRLRKIHSFVKRKRHKLQNGLESSTQTAIKRIEKNSRNLSLHKNLVQESISHFPVNSGKVSAPQNFIKKTDSCIPKTTINLPVPEDGISKMDSLIKENQRNLPVPEDDLKTFDIDLHKTYKKLTTPVDDIKKTVVDAQENCRNLSVSEHKIQGTVIQLHENSKHLSVINERTKIRANYFKDSVRNARRNRDITPKPATFLQEIFRNLPVNKDLAKKSVTSVRKNPKNFPVSGGPSKKINTQENSRYISVIKESIKKKLNPVYKNATNGPLYKDCSPSNLPVSEHSSKKLLTEASKRFTNLPHNKEKARKKSDCTLVKKSKKLFQINKGGVFHSFSQNLIRISSVASLTSSEEAKPLADREPEKKVPLTEKKSSNFVPPMKLNVVVKSSPSDDEDSSPSSPKDDALLLSPTLQVSAKDSAILPPSKDSANGLELLTTKIKSEPSTVVNVKSETVIEECLNVTMEEDDTHNYDKLSKLDPFSLEEDKSGAVWVSAPEKYPHFDGEGEMRCTLCLISFPNFISLVDHLEKHQRNGFILCYYCQKSFGDKTSMRRHMRTHTGEKPYQCKICEKRFSLPGNFKKHRDIHEDIRTEPCDICGKTFRRKEHLKYHKRTHTGEKPFKCTLCGSCFTARYSLQIHMNIHLGKKPYKCSDCGKAFCDKSTMRKHIRVHTGERPFNCRVCHKSFGESGSLTAHAATHSQERPFLCSHCHLAFKTSGGLRQHVKTHIGDKQFSCKYCGMMFIQKYNMMMHERIHTGEKPYECSECHRTFRSRSCLGKHIILHGGDAERKYSCDHCDKKFFRKAHLKRHINTHLGIKEYECTFCSKKFSTSGSLKKHLATFHTEGARAFPCIMCGRTFKRSIYVATHKCIASIIKMETDE